MKKAQISIAIAILIFGSACGMMITADKAYAQTFVTKWGTKGSADGQFSAPRGLAVDSNGNVYVTDTRNHRIQIFTNDGEFIAKWDKEGRGDGEFRNVVAIAVDPSDNVYVIDQSGYRIQKLTTDGSFLTKWEHTEVEYDETEIYSAFAIAADSENNVYVLDFGNGTSNVKKFTTEGEFVMGWPADGDVEGNAYSATGIAIDGSDNVYIVGYDKLGTGTAGGVIKKFTTEGEFIKDYGKMGLGDGMFIAPFAIGVDATGNAYVADDSTSLIQKFTTEGEFVTKWGSRGSEDGQFLNALGIATDSAGNVFISEDLGNRVQKFTFGDVITQEDDENALEPSSHSVTVQGEPVQLILESSSMISSFDLDESKKQVSLHVDDAGTAGTIVIPIGKVLEGPYVVTVDDQAFTDFEVTKDPMTGQDILSMDYAVGSHEITVTGTNVVPEFPLAIIMAVMGIGAAVVIGRARLRMI